MAYRDQNKGIARGNWSLEFKRRYNQENPDAAVCEEHGCGKTAEGQFVIPDYYETLGGDIYIWKCKEHARGTWCLGCGSFIGGTEDVFRYPDYECSHCEGWVLGEFGEEYEDDEDEPLGIAGFIAVKLIDRRDSAESIGLTDGDLPF